ncbi:MAG TPA: hypothetical protein VHD14_12330 [Pseudolabrys sp.]|nr:hypothetical protein [Pseudolabrys sp.]
MSDINSCSATARHPALTLEQTIHGWAGVLGLWRLCPNATCRRSRACRGAAIPCFRAHFPLLPESVQAWFVCIGEAQNEGQSYDEAIESMEGSIAEGALERWHAHIAEADSISREHR